MLAVDTAEHSIDKQQELIRHEPSSLGEGGYHLRFQRSRLIPCAYRQAHCGHLIVGKFWRDDARLGGGQQGIEEATLHVLEIAAHANQDTRQKERRTNLRCIKNRLTEMLPPHGVIQIREACSLGRPVSDNSVHFDEWGQLTSDGPSSIFGIESDQVCGPLLYAGARMSSMFREPILTRTGWIVIPAFALSFAVIASVRAFGYESSVLGTLGVLIVTHVISGMANAILEHQCRQEAYFSELNRMRQWQESQPDPFDQGASEDQTSLNDRIEALASKR